MNKTLILQQLAWLCALIVSSSVMAADTPQIAGYLLRDAPVFDTTLEQFRAGYNKTNPKLTIKEYGTITATNDNKLIEIVASEITPQLYSSVVIDRNSKKIKSFQLTHLPVKEAVMEKTAYATAVNYMSASVCWFNPTLPSEQCKIKVTQLLGKAHKTNFYQRVDGAVRYIAVESEQQGITLAIEPVKLMLTESD